MRKLAPILVVGFALACGRQEPQSPNNAVAPAASSTTGGSSGGSSGGKATGSSGSTGSGSTGGTAPGKQMTVAQIRQAKLSNGAAVSISNAVVTAISGTGKTIWVADAAGGNYSGIAVSVCDSKTAVCAANPPAEVGAAYSVSGTYLVTKDGTYASLVDPTFTSVTGAGPVPAFVVQASEIAQGSTANADVRGVYVSVGDATVADAAPTGQDFLNAAYTSAMENACRGLGVTKDTSQCCPSHIGPKYYGFVAQAGPTQIEVSTSNYSSKYNGSNGVGIEVWPCDGDFSKILVNGQDLGTLAGVFDINFGAATLYPATPHDYTVTKTSSGGSSSGGSSGSATGASSGTSSGSSSGTSSSGGSSGGSTGSTTGSSDGGSSGGGQLTPMCDPCTSDWQCGQPGNLCHHINSDGSGFCGYSCQSNADCPPGAQCTTQDVDGLNCFPISNTCN